MRLRNKMKKPSQIFSFLILSLFAIPFFAFADLIPNLIVCQGTTADPCTFESLISLFKVAVNALIEIATLITVAALIMMGFKLMTSGGNPSARTEVKNRAWAILKGYFFILAAWVIVYTITSVLVKDGFSLLQK